MLPARRSWVVFSRGQPAGRRWRLQQVQAAWQTFPCVARDALRTELLTSSRVAHPVERRGLCAAAKPPSTAGKDAAPSSLLQLIEAEGHQRFIFVGGKGGVGKTTTAAALALRLAASGKKTLVVSTDPAHSLGDALAETLGGEPKPVDLRGLEAGLLQGSGGSLHAMEIDPNEVVQEFRKNLHLDHLRELLKEGRAGLGAALLHALSQAGIDLDTLTNLLDLSPPGIDEAVALLQLVQLLGDGRHGHFDAVVIDTAPTGHTLRLLSFPRFLHTSIQSLLSVVEKVRKVTPFPSMFGKMVSDDMLQQLRNTKSQLERSMDAMNKMDKIFADKDKTSFVVVAIPTHLAVAESKRLLRALQQSGMPARHVIVNQCPFLTDSSQAADEAQVAHQAAEKLQTQVAAAGVSEKDGQILLQLTRRIVKQHQDAKQQLERLREHAGSSVCLTSVPVFDMELTGPPALAKYAAALCPRQYHDAK
eukprot:TRINITY_DN58773_c0_g2_i1.p1 TRINITY_DN58773_c0_g2~~TRINITY_DN58773_c0_g2_i1.p1  ORF type:complete len:475 (+),score=130.39 TRINITY_DN58773_c0_g2_i1:82-1506(+)